MSEGYVNKGLFNEMQRLFDEAWIVNEKANELLINTWRSLDQADMRRWPLEAYFREVGMYIDGKVFE